MELVESKKRGGIPEEVLKEMKDIFVEGTYQFCEQIKTEEFEEKFKKSKEFENLSFSQKVLFQITLEKNERTLYRKNEGDGNGDCNQKF